MRIYLLSVYEQQGGIGGNAAWRGGQGKWEEDAKNKQGAENKRGQNGIGLLGEGSDPSGRATGTGKS